ncbi:hypothetical protein [Streptomyces sp. NPDC059161]|uniref:hypothetical protein n=1 Tax=unclassified Streptomyces TaxID=2593676 RepID=UPI003653FDEC
MKVAAAVAGSLAVVGAAAPAFAAGDLTPPPMSLNAGVDTLAQHLATSPMADAMPLQTHLLDPKSNDSLRHTMVSTARGLDKVKRTAPAGQHLGGLPVGQRPGK